MRPFFLSALVPFVCAIDSNHEPAWVKSVVASAKSAYAPWVTASSEKIVERQDKSTEIFTPRDGPLFAYRDRPCSRWPPFDAHPSGDDGTSGYPFHPPQGDNDTDPTDSCSYWLENFEHQGIAPYAGDANYQVFRNVKDFGAVGDGVTDDTAAINRAISSGNRCAPFRCKSSTTTPAVVYFPSGTYLVSSSIINYYNTQIIGNPRCLPTIQAASTLTGWVIDSNGFGATDTFFRQIRNLIVDMTNVPPEVPVTGIFWPTAQTTRLQNMIFKMSDAPGTQHQGVFISEGSGGVLNDLTAYGGRYGFNWGNQQFTMSNLTVRNAVTAINQIWNWGFTYSGLNIDNCSVGLNMSGGAPNALSVGAVMLFDSVFSNTPVGIEYGRSSSSQPPAANSLVIENVLFDNVPTIVLGPSGTVLPGSAASEYIDAWAAGHAYTPGGPNVIEGSIAPNQRPSSLLIDGKYFNRAKPDFEGFSASDFLSVRSLGAAGDGTTDDTAAFQSAITTAVSQNKVLFIDAGVYLLTNTIYIPANTRMTGEAYPTLLAAGSLFTSMTSPRPFLQIGKPNEAGTVELTDIIVSGRGPLAGAIFIEYNLASASPTIQKRDSQWPNPDSQNWHNSHPTPSPPSGPSTVHDVHVRIGGFTGSSLSLSNCPITPQILTPPAPIPSQCIAAFAAMHITPSASNLLLSGNWLWTADHDIDDPQLRQITIYSGRGLYVDHSAGPLWLWGTASEHHTLYQYQFEGVKDIFTGFVQTETAYYQPNPPAGLPFPAVEAWGDPVFKDECYTTSGGNYTKGWKQECDGWGVRVTEGSEVLMYGVGLYSFFANNNVSCASGGSTAECQLGVFDVQGQSRVGVYGLNTVGVEEMVTLDGVGGVSARENVAGFSNSVVVFRTG